MKQPPGIWFLLSAGVLWLSIHNVYGLKASELIFKKASSSTTTTGTSVSSEQPVDEVSTEAASEAANVTKSFLTGNPQIDYVYDPNLPRELNGYNLSSYPFYETLPKNITFKCDGLHDGFYASIPHKCQVYHHCLSGTRYDFLCANYTAFDQTIFNCHFVSEVDCDNSQKFWHRNDALYKTASTTTTIQPTPIVISPALTGSPKRPPPPLGRRRTPSRRRPPYEEEYDDEEYDDEKEDEYEPPPRRRRKRPRPRPRPVYDDEYEEYEDRYERRSSGRRNEDRRHEYEDDNRRSHEKPTDRHVEEEKQEKRNDKRKPSDERRYKDERKREYEDADAEDDYMPRRRPVEKRRPNYERPRKPQRRPYDDDLYDDEKLDDRRVHKERPLKVDDPYDDEKLDDKRVHKERPLKVDDLYDDEKLDDRRVHKGRPLKVPKVQQSESDSSVLVKPHGPSSVYNQPRVPPRIKSMSKIAQKPTTLSEKLTTSSEKPVTTKKPLDDAEYYDEYEDEVPAKVTTTTKAPELTMKRSKFRTTQKPPLYDDEDSDDNPPVSSNSKKPIMDGEIGIRYTIPKFTVQESRSKTTTSTTTTTTSAPTTTTTTSTTTTEAPKERSEPVVRVMKRPFLPSRGGNPYFVRGLQPVGAKALDPSKYESDLPAITNKFENNQAPIQTGRQFPTQFQEKEQLSNKPIAILEPEVKRNQPQIPTLPKFAPKNEEQTRVKSKVPERNPLDINEEDYDVTLNDALNPTIPNLPVRSFPTGFGVPPSDFIYDALERQRFNVGYNIPPESFLPKNIRQRDETVVAQPQTYRNQFYSQNLRPNSQITQANAHGFYRSF